MNTLYEQLLLFPDRAESLEQFGAYEVDIRHWAQLSSVFQATFPVVFERQSSAILLVHGAQGTGKTLFARRLDDDFRRSGDAVAQGPVQGDSQNLWHTLVGGDPPHGETIRRATLDSHLARVEPAENWLDEQRSFAKRDKHRVRIFLIDDVQKDVFIRAWLGISQAEYVKGIKAQRAGAAVLSSVAEKLVEDCRGDFRRSIFVLFSNDEPWLQGLAEHIARSHRGLAQIVELPLPEPGTKEHIVRKNTNRLNRLTYWHCLDAAGKDERSAVYDVLTAPDGGFIDSFQAVDSALRSDARRAGRPANKNLLTLLTLGTPPEIASVFLNNRDIDGEVHHLGKHIGVWMMRSAWASRLNPHRDLELSRRARLVESEFALRWVALDMTAFCALCEPPAPGDIGSRLLSIARFFPSVAKPQEVEASRAECIAIDDALESSADLVARVAPFEAHMRDLRQARSSVYEPALTTRLAPFGRYNRGLAAHPAVRPDFIVSEYAACEVTQAQSNDPDAITKAIRRTGHTIEITSFLRPELEGLEEYLLDKVRRYAELLESA